jgi:hypothetical protein
MPTGVYRGVASGRADVLHDFGRVQVVTEIKRESDDASIDSLLGNYGEQTSAHQNSNVPVGILLALEFDEKPNRWSVHQRFV